MRNKSLGRECDPAFVPRGASSFQIGPNSSPRKVQRWLNRGGGVRPSRLLHVLEARHIHPRHLRGEVV
jgi:hypothetical protein